MHKRLREAIEFCSDDVESQYGIKFNSDHMMPPRERLAMEKCLTKNYLLKHGLDYFGKKDFIYIDMMGQSTYERMGGLERIVEFPDYMQKEN